MRSLAPLHDIGKVGVPDHILHKPGALTPEELVEMRKHPGYGRDVIVHAEDHAGVHDDVILTLAKDIVYTHHEKWDGSGYPQGLSGRDIPIPGRVMAIVDVYDASTTRQLYRTAAVARRGRRVHRQGQRHALRPGRRRRVSPGVAARFAETRRWIPSTRACELTGQGWSSQLSQERSAALASSSYAVRSGCSGVTDT